jgi:hypothetical protein
VWCLSTVVCLLVFCVTLSSVVCLLVFCVAFVHSCLSVDFLCGVCPQVFVSWFVNKRHTENQQTNNCGQSHTENQQTNNCGQTPHRKLNNKPTRTPLTERIEDKQLWTQKTNKQLWTNATPKTNRQTSVDKGHTVNQKTNNCGQTPHRFVGFLCPQLFVFYPLFQWGSCRLTV